MTNNDEKQTLAIGSCFFFPFLGLCFGRGGLGNRCVGGGSGMETKNVFHIVEKIF
jgi:hypothetical protein